MNQSKAKPFPAEGKLPRESAFTKCDCTPKAVATPKGNGYPQDGIKTSGVKTRGNGAATKGTMARGPMG